MKNIKLILAAVSLAATMLSTVNVSATTCSMDQNDVSNHCNNLCSQCYPEGIIPSSSSCVTQCACLVNNAGNTQTTSSCFEIIGPSSCTQNCTN